MLSCVGARVARLLWAQVCRAILLLLCWIPFNYTGYPMTWRTFLVFLWGGLRGAVGMVMALFVFLDEEIHNSKFRSYAIFYMGTMVRLHPLAGRAPRLPPRVVLGAFVLNAFASENVLVPHTLLQAFFTVLINGGTVKWLLK